MLNRLFSTGLFLLVSLPANSQAPEVMSEEQYLRQETQIYEKCVSTARENPKAALDSALTWRDTGGGLPARHCAAVAYLNLGEYLNAALELETLADEMRRGLGWPFESAQHPNQTGLLAEVYAQGGNAWLLDGDPTKAFEFFTLGLAEAETGSKTHIDLLIDRSLAAAEMGDYQKALDDLISVEGLVKPNADIHVLKASAYRALEEFPKAQAEIEKAFRLDPQNREGFLERGNLLRALGDDEGARQNWMAYLRLYPDGPAAEIIRKNLAAMDVNDGEEE